MVSTRVLVILFFLYLYSNSSQASLLTVEFEGLLNQADTELIFNGNERFWGSYTYDLSLDEDALPDNDKIGRYFSIVHYELTLGSNQFIKGGAVGYIQVADRTRLGLPSPDDEWINVVQRGFDTVNPFVNGFWLYQAAFSAAKINSFEIDGIGLIDYIPFNASDYSYKLLFTSRDYGFLQANGTITKMAIKSVSEPGNLGSIVLLSVLFFGAKAKRKSLTKF